MRGGKRFHAEVEPLWFQRFHLKASKDAATGVWGTCVKRRKSEGTQLVIDELHDSGLANIQIHIDQCMPLLRYIQDWNCCRRSIY